MATSTGLTARKLKTGVLAGGCAIIVAYGAYLGASFKTQQEKSAVKNEFVAENREQQIKRLEEQKAVFIRKREKLLRKIKDLDEDKSPGRQKQVGEI